jgi:hypothetical protein
MVTGLLAWHDEQRQQRHGRPPEFRTVSMPPTITQPICWRLMLRAGAVMASASGMAPSTIAPVVIRIGRSRSTRRFDRRAVVHAAALARQLVGELDDQDAVLGDQPDERDQADLAVDVERAARE